MEQEKDDAISFDITKGLILNNGIRFVVTVKGENGKGELEEAFTVSFTLEGNLNFKFQDTKLYLYATVGEFKFNNHRIESNPIQITEDDYEKRVNWLVT